MNRLRAILMTGLMSVAGLGAKSLPLQSIEVGQIVGGVNLGLTDAYVTGSAPCVGAAQGNSCIATSNQPTLNSGGFTEAGYDATLWAGASLTSPQPYTGYSSSAANSGQMVDPSSLVPFAMIDDGATSGNSNNIWDAMSASSITIPIGIFDVQQVWTMLNDRFGLPGQDVSVTFNFSSTPDGSSGLTPIQVALTNGSQIRGGVDCESASPMCPGFTQGLGAASTINGVTVSASQIFSAAYSYNAGHGKYSNSTGNLVLDDQEFNFGTSEANAYLVDIVVSDSSGALNVNQTALSAITVLTPAPEPGTLIMIGLGLTALGFVRRRHLS